MKYYKSVAAYNDTYKDSFFYRKVFETMHTMFREDIKSAEQMFHIMNNSPDWKVVQILTPTVEGYLQIGLTHKAALLYYKQHPELTPHEALKAVRQIQEQMNNHD